MCELCLSFDAGRSALCLSCQQDEQDAMQFEYSQLLAQKNNPAVKWTPGKQRHLDQLAQAVKSIPAQKDLL